ncbi:MAG: hybrid sensor histidine kinase/response regulator [Roseateles sp.]
MTGATSTDELRAQQHEAALYDERRLGVLVRFSASLRWPMHLIAAVIATIAWAGGAAITHTMAWLLCAIVVRELRAAALLRLEQEHGHLIAQRFRQITWWTVGLGLAHGSSALFMLQLDTAHEATLTMVLVSLSAGAVSTTFTVPSAFMGYAAGICIPTAAMWLAGGDGLSISIGALVLLFMAVQLRFARQNLQLFEESYQMRLENMALLRQLSEERAQQALARDAAVRADRSKSEFLAAASHDLRQPLQSLALNSGALSRLLAGRESQQVADEMQLGIEALRQMLDALLDVSKLDAGAVKFTLQPIPLDRLVAGLCARFRPAALSKGLQLEHSGPADTMVLSDVDLLQRIVSNLIDNALKFTLQGGITLTIQPKPGVVLLRVQDSGIGIAAADQERVFDDLVQLANPQRERSFGHGLGLGIVRRLTQLLGIACSMQSEPGRGTCFDLEIPAADASEPLPGDAAPPRLALRARHVLVLDDDPSVRAAYARALQSQGCKAWTVGTLAEACTAVSAQAPEIALVDNRLAEASTGLQAIARLRALVPGLPAVIVSADSSAELGAQAATLGVNILRKPVSEAALVQAINSALQGIAQARSD